MIASLKTAADWMKGSLEGPDGQFGGVSIDSRSIADGDLFFAIAGPNFDGHDYVASAAEKGAAGAVVARDDISAPSTIRVDDPREALGLLAREWRRRRDALTVGLTGSNGKTTLKELIASILGRSGSTLATEGNLNNDLGVPLMLMRLRSEHDYAVIEMGANHEGEIAYLTSLVEPDIVVLNNAGPSHLEGFGSMDGVARGKGEILRGTPRPRTAILNADDVYYEFWRQSTSDIDVVTFGIEAPADVRADDISVNEDATEFTLVIGNVQRPVRLALHGLHNVKNACAAAAVTHAMKIDLNDIVAGLESATAVGGRLQALPGVNGSTVFNDSYNANPASVIAAAQYLVTGRGRSVMVLGDMYELGPDADEVHAKLGRELAGIGVDALYAVGEQSRQTVKGFGSSGRWFEDQATLIDALLADLDETSRVIVKGSRSTRMERVVEGITDRAEVTA